MRPDDIAMFHNYRAKATGMSPADYANPIEPPPTQSTYPKLLWLSLVLGLAVALAATLDWI